MRKVWSARYALYCAMAVEYCYPHHGTGWEERSNQELAPFVNTLDARNVILEPVMKENTL